MGRGASTRREAAERVGGWALISAVALVVLVPVGDDGQTRAVIGAITTAIINVVARPLWQQQFRVKPEGRAEFRKTEPPAQVTVLDLDDLPSLTSTVTVLVRASRRGRDTKIGPKPCGPTGTVSIPMLPGVAQPLDWSKEKLRVRVIVRFQDDSTRTVFQKWIRTPTD